MNTFDHNDAEQTGAGHDGAIPQTEEERGKAIWHGNRLLVSCDCAQEEHCGTWLGLTVDGILVLEDKDGLLVSICLPDWLEAPMRYAAQRQQVQGSEPRRLRIVFEYDGSDRQSLAYFTATLKDLFDTAAWVAHINDAALSDVNMRFTDTAVTPSATMAIDDHRDQPVSDAVPF